MDFLNDLGRKTSAAASKTVQKTQELVGVTKLNSRIAEEEKKLNTCYSEIGKQYVFLHGADCDEELFDLVQTAREVEQKIEKFRENICELQRVQCCPKCGAKIPRGTKFCTECGTPLPKVEDSVPSDRVVCKKCGATMGKNVKFCTSCGNPMPRESVLTPAPAPWPAPESAPAPWPAPESASNMMQNGHVSDGNFMPPAPEPAPWPAPEPASWPTPKPVAEPISASENSKEQNALEITGGKVCPVCGVKLPVDVAFCTECGTAL